MNDKIAIYLRLSLADGDLKKGSKDESNSIENQRMLLHDYIGKQEDLFGEIVEYVDTLPCSSFAPGQLGASFSLVLPMSLPPDVAKGMIVLPFQS